MLEAILRTKVGDRIDVASAGTKPAEAVNPMAVRVLGEIGIAHEGAVPKSPDVFGDRRFDVAITVCGHAKEACPVLPGAKMVHVGYPDPPQAGNEEEQLAAFRTIRDSMLMWTNVLAALLR
jgi:arsenate reductase